MKLKYIAATVLVLLLAFLSPASAAPVKILFDTDIGNDVDDVLALSLLHALQSRHECEIIGVTVTKRDDLAGPFVSAMDTFYGRPKIPIGCAKPSPDGMPSKFLSLASARDGGKLRYPHQLKHGTDAPRPLELLRRLLTQQPDDSVVMVQVGYFSNFGELVENERDRALVKQKVKFLSVMAGAFSPELRKNHFCEFNVVKDIPASRKLAGEWPTPIVWSGAEIGAAVPYPAASIERDYNYVPHHPAAEAYCLFNPPPHERPTWDLTAALYAVLPDRGYFDLSPAGRVTVEADGFTHFVPEEGGRDHYLILKPGQIPRLKEALVQLASQPPQQLPAK